MFTLAALVSTALAAQAPEVGVVIEPMVAVDLSAPPGADDWENWTWLRAHARQKLDNGHWFLAVRADHNIRSGSDTESIWRMAVGESGWAGAVGKTHLRVGNLIERWGKLDLLPTLDVLNPRDLRAGPLSTIEAARVATPMISLAIGSDTVRMGLSYAPFPEGDYIQMMGSDWSIIKPGMMEDFVDGMAGWEGDSAFVLAEPIEQLSSALRDLDPSTQRALGNAVSASGRPEDTGINGNVGARFAVEATGIDGALVVANLRSPIPLTRLGSRYRSMLQSETLPSFDALGDLGAEAPLSSAWPRTWMTGAEVSTVLGPLGLRAEGAWWSSKVHQQTWLDATTRSTTAGGLGLDYTSGSWLFVGLEGRWQHMMRPIKRPFLTQADVFEVGATARLSLAGDRLLISTATVVNPTFSEGLARPEIRWVSSDSLSLGIGAILLYGESPPPADLAEALAYAAGPISMMSDNDAVFFSLRWSH